MSSLTSGKEIYSLSRLGGNNSADLSSIGLVGSYVSTGTKYTGVFRDFNDGVWKFFSGLTDAPTRTVVSTAGAGYADAAIQASLAKLTSTTNQLQFGPAATAITLSGTGTGARTLTLPDATDTLVGRATVDTLTNKTLTSPTISGGAATGLTGLAIRDTSAAFDVTLAAVSSVALNAGRTLTLDMKNAARSVALGGNISLGGGLTTAGAVEFSGSFGTTFTVGATTALTLPATGTLATLGGAETFTNKTLTSPTINGGAATGLTGLAIRDTSAAFDVTLAAVSSVTLTAGRALTLDMKNAARSVALGGNISLGGGLTTAGAVEFSGSFGTTFTVGATTALTLPATGTLATLGGTETFTNKTLTSPTINGGAATGLTGLAIRDTSAAFDVTLAAVSSVALDAGRTLTLDMKNAARSVALGGNISLGGGLTTAGAFTMSGAFSTTLTATASTSVTLPTTGTLATLAGVETLYSKTLDAKIYSSYDHETLTISASAGTVTGSGTTFTAAMIGGWIVPIDKTYQPLFVSNVTNATTITSSSSQTIPAGTKFYLKYENGVNYTTGTISQNGFMVTGSGTTFTSAMVGGHLSHTLSSSDRAIVTKFISATRLIVSHSVTFGDSAYTLKHSPTNTYATATASQSGTTITGVGTAFTSDMVGGVITFDNYTTAVITGYTSATSLTSSTSQTVNTSSFWIEYGGTYANNTTSIPLNTSALGEHEVLRSYNDYKTSRLSFMQLTNGIYSEPSTGSQKPYWNINSNWTSSTATGNTRTSTNVARFSDAGLQLPLGSLILGGTGFDIWGSAGTFTTTVTATTPSAARTYTLADTGADDTFAMLAATQTLTNKTLTAPVISSISNSGTITLPTGTRTLATLDGTETFTNKTLTTPVISSISNSGTITLPTGTRTLATLDGVETLQNKSLIASSTYIVDSVDTTKGLRFAATGTTGVVGILSCGFTTAKTVTLPDATTTLVGRDTTDTLTNKTLTSASIGTELLVPTSIPIRFSNGVADANYAIKSDSTNGLQIIDNTIGFVPLRINGGFNYMLSQAGGLLKFDMAGATSGMTTTLDFNHTGNRTLTLPDATDTLVGRATTDTLTNKSMWGSGVITTGGTVYQTGTASQSGTTITGTGTTFTQAMVGGILRYSSTGSFAFITGYTSATQLTSSNSLTISPAESFAIRYDNFTLNDGGTRMGLPTTMYRNGYAIDFPTLTAGTDQFILRDASPTASGGPTATIKNKRFDNTCAFTLSSDNTRTVTILPNNANSTNVNLQFVGTTTGVTHIVPNCASNTNFIMETVASGSQTINNTLNMFNTTTSGTATITSTTNQMVLGAATRTITISANAPTTTSKTCTIQASNNDEHFVMSARLAVTQTTSNSTAVTANGASVTITSFGAHTTAPGSPVAFTFNNTYITSTSIVMATIVNYTGSQPTNGLPVVAVQGINTGVCSIVVSNAHSTNSLNGVIKIGIVVA